MLEISKNSWHYRLWMLGRDSTSRPKNLCKYFWHLAIFKILLPFVLGSFVLLGIGALLYVIWGHPAVTAITILATLLCVGLVVGLIELGQRLYDKHQAKVELALLNPEPPKPKKEPGVLRTFLKARKQKMCPLIQVIDD